MIVKIRLARAGSKKKPYYKIVVASSNAPRDGKFLEKVGVYNPLLQKNDKNRVVLLHERIKYWISVGAKATEIVSNFLKTVDYVKNNGYTKLSSKSK